MMLNGKERGQKLKERWLKMAKYLEFEELVIGDTYRCETYLGHELLLRYLGDGDFKRLNGLDYLGDMILSLDWVVRYVFERVR
jgi:hypothetical protein